MAFRFSGQRKNALTFLLSGLMALICGTAALAQTRNMVPTPKGADSEQRLALVIGNAGYAQSPLANPVNDATDMAATLKELGFKVIFLANANQKQMKDGIRQFGDGLLKGGVGLFYYAGHGLQYRGRNFLVPIGAAIEREVHIEEEAVDAGMILSYMEEGRARVNVVILDACRNNPFARGASRQAGLAEMKAAGHGTLISFATSPGSVALDGEGRNGLYTQNLLKQIRQPGVPIELMFKRVRDGVMQATQDQQVPWDTSSLYGADFYFKPSVAVAPPPAPEPQQNLASALMAAEIAFWESIKTSGSQAEYEAYIQKFPNGQFTALAQVRLDALRREAAAKPPQVQVATLAPTAVPVIPQSAKPPPVPSSATQAPRPSAPAPKPSSASRASAVKGARDCANCPELVVLPTGRFVMGSADDESGRDVDEGPAHSVSISRQIALGRFEVTRGEFARFVQDAKYAAGPGCNTWTGKEWKNDPAKDWRNPGFPQTDQDPVVCVSWNDAKAYVQWLSRTTGKQYRLPTEAEWEYAARAGTTSPYFWGASAESGCKFANLVDQSARKAFSAWAESGCSDGYAFTAPVGRFEPNAFGLHDMAGNVWEWTEDCWSAGYVGSSLDGAPSISGDCSRRVLRGGSWSNYLRLARSAHRYGSLSVSRGAYNGFRVARVD